MNRPRNTSECHVYNTPVLYTWHGMYCMHGINQGDVLLILQYLAVSLNGVLANYFFKVPLGACPFVVALLPPPGAFGTQSIAISRLPLTFARL